MSGSYIGGSSIVYLNCEFSEKLKNHDKRKKEKELEKIKIETMKERLKIESKSKKIAKRMARNKRRHAKNLVKKRLKISEINIENTSNDLNKEALSDNTLKISPISVVKKTQSSNKDKTRLKKKVKKESKKKKTIVNRRPLIEHNIMYKIYLENKAGGKSAT